MRRAYVVGVRARERHRLHAQTELAHDRPADSRVTAGGVQFAAHGKTRSNQATAEGYHRGGLRYALRQVQRCQRFLLGLSTERQATEYAHIVIALHSQLEYRM